ncbi:phosphopentomutase, partial [Buchnera aphidicola (Stegophylla sp.)]|nr:phosphopentomutase [Buchnera aphidicola (Stegophylla sp.)]
EYCYFGRANDNRFGYLNIPNLMSLGLGKVYKYLNGHYPFVILKSSKIIGSYGYAREISSSKDTSSGHWEIAGVPVLFKWDYFNIIKNSFTSHLLKE